MPGYTILNGKLVKDREVDELVTEIIRILDGCTADRAMYVLDTCREKIGELAIIKAPTAAGGHEINA